MDYFNTLNTTSRIYNTLFDLTHDGIVNSVTPNIQFYISDTKDGVFTAITNEYSFAYSNNSIKYLKIVAKQFNVIHTYVIPFTVLNDGASPESIMLIPRMINGTVYEDKPIAFKQNSYLGSNYLTQMYYKTRSMTNILGVFTGNNAAMKFSFSNDGPFVIGSEFKFDKPIDSEGTVYVEYLFNNIRYTGEFLYHVVSGDSDVNNAYINSINSRGISPNGVFVFLTNETLRLSDYKGTIGYNYYPDGFSMYRYANGSNTIYYEHSNSTSSNRVHFTYVILGNDNQFHEIGPDYMFGKAYATGHKYAALSDIVDGVFE